MADERSGVAVERERDSLAEQLANAQRECERLDRENRKKDDFLAILSHEMRSPLNAVLTWAQVLRSPSVDPATIRQAIASIERSARLQTRMIEDLLDTARINSGKLSLDLVDADLAQIARSAVEQEIAAANDKRIEIEVEIDPGPIPVRVDAARLQQAVANLISNAIKFTPEGGNVRVNACCSGPQAQILVTDTGEGIAADVLPHIFDRFWQRDQSTTRRSAGLGLGLSIARHILEMHGGTIRASSDGAQCGASFQMRLPLRSTDAPETAVEPSRRGAASLGSYVLLVVDDDVDTCLALATILGQAGADVRTANSVAEAIRSFEAHRPHAVLADLAMPDEDGYSLIRRIRASHDEAAARIPVIALTASASPSDRRKVRRAGFALHLTKPVEPASVVDAVRLAVPPQLPA